MEFDEADKFINGIYLMWLSVIGLDSMTQVVPSIFTSLQSWKKERSMKGESWEISLDSYTGSLHMNTIFCRQMMAMVAVIGYPEYDWVPRVWSYLHTYIYA